MRLEGWEYDEIEEIATDLLEDLGFSQFPLNPFEVANKLSIEIKKYSEIPNQNKDFVISKYEDGFSSLIAKSKYIIYYDEKISYKRIIFTLWYEIGHIQLGHYDNETKTQERMKAECNYFAKFLIAPMPFVIIFHPLCPVDISNEFLISNECATYVYEDFLNAIQYSSITDKILSKRIARLLQYNKKTA